MLLFAWDVSSAFVQRFRVSLKTNGNGGGSAHTRRAPPVTQRASELCWLRKSKNAPERRHGLAASQPPYRSPRVRIPNSIRHVPDQAQHPVRQNIQIGAHQEFLSGSVTEAAIERVDHSAYRPEALGHR